jgi:hypothetical protein
MVRVHRRTQIVERIVASVTSGFSAPGVLAGSGKAVYPSAGVVRATRTATTREHSARFAELTTLPPQGSLPPLNT